MKTPIPPKGYRIRKVGDIRRKSDIVYNSCYDRKKLWDKAFPLYYMFFGRPVVNGGYIFACKIKKRRKK